MSENNIAKAVEEAALYPPLPGATFGEAVKRYFKKYAVFSGRASRSEYWWTQLFLVLVSLVLGIFVMLGSSTTPSGAVSFNGFGVLVIIIASIWALATIIPSLALLVRRLHDANFSGWFVLLNLIPGGSFVVFIFTLLASNPAGIRYDAGV